MSCYSFSLYFISVHSKAFMFILLLLFIVLRNGMCGEAIIDLGTSDFAKLVKTSAFVDKSLLIQQAVSLPFAIINAPRLFGKSTVIDMLKRFFEIEVNELGRPLSAYMNTALVINDTSNYKIFLDNNLAILKNNSVMAKYFGKYPVISLDLKISGEIVGEDEAYHVYNNAIYASYRQHRYLINSTYLTDRDKRAIQRMCRDDNLGGKYQYIDVLYWLEELARHLKTHFYGIKPVLLIDNHDSVFTNALMNGVEYDEIDCINSLLINILLSFKRKESSFCFATGVHDIAVLGVQFLNNQFTHRFMDIHQNMFNGFYGLTQEEVEGLFAKPEFNKYSSSRQMVEKAYSGYTDSNGNCIYNMYSVLNFLKYGKIDNYWMKKSSIRTMVDSLIWPVLTDVIASALNSTLFPTHPQDKVDLRNYIQDDDVDSVIIYVRNADYIPDSVTTNLKFFLTHLLLQNGYIYRKDVPSPYLIANNEVKEALNELVK